MKRFLPPMLFIVILFSLSLFSCRHGEPDSSSVTLTVLAPGEISLHGYKSGDLSACKLELVRSNGESSFRAVDPGVPVSFWDLRNDNYTATAYGYDAFGTPIALSDQISFYLDDGSSLSDSLQLIWHESGKEPDQYCAVRFDTDGGSSVSEQKVRSGSTVMSPGEPTKSDFSFGGWFWDSSKEHEFDFAEAISWSITLHAKWESGSPAEENQTCTVTFNKNDGTDETNEWAHEKDTDFYFPDGGMFGDRSGEGYYFWGWATYASAQTPEYYTNDRFTISEDKTFYAVWAKESCTITLINSYDPSEKTSTKVGKNSKFSLESLAGQSNFTAPQGYSYAGLSPYEDGSEVAYSVEAESDSTYYVVWSVWLVCHESPNVDENGDEYQNWTQYFYGSSISEPDYTPYWQNHIFEGWYADENLTVPADFAKLSAASADSNARIHVYAKWTETRGTIGITVTLPTYSESDIGISDESSGTTLRLVATSGYDSYSWEFDGTADSQTGNSFTKDLSSLSAGSYDVYLEAEKGGILYSCSVQVTIPSGTAAVPASGGVVNGVECSNMNAVYQALHALPDNAEATITLGSDFSFNAFNWNQTLLWGELQQKNNRSITLDFSNCTTTKFSGLALRNLQSIVGIIFPATLREIEAGAFDNCNRLESVTFAEGSVLETIGARAFYQTTALKEVTLPETIKSIGEKAFENSALTKLEFKNTSDTWTIKGSRGTISEYSVDNAETNATNIRLNSEYTGAWTRND